MLWTRAGRRAPMTPLRLVLASAAGSAAADFGDQVDLALGFQRDEVGVLEDFAVDRHRHTPLDLAAEAGVPAVELEHRYRTFQNARRIVVKHRPGRLAYAVNVMPIGLVHDVRDGGDIGSRRRADASLVHGQPRPLPRWS